MEFTVRQRANLLFSYVVHDLLGLGPQRNGAAHKYSPPSNGDFTETRGNVPARSNGVISEKEHDEAINWLVSTPPLEK